MAGILSAAAAKAVEMEAAGVRAGRDVNENPQQASTAAEKKQHVCTHCGAQHASSSALFRHLRAQCDPTLNKENTAKLAVVVAYAGDAQLGADASICCALAAGRSVSTFVSHCRKPSSPQRAA